MYSSPNIRNFPDEPFDRKKGTSISDYDSQQIFDRFFTGDRDAGHTGLGLNLVQTQLRTHKGDITLLRDSKLVTFRVTLPLMS